MEKLHNYLLLIFAIGIFSCQEEALTKYQPSQTIAENSRISGLQPITNPALSWCNLVRSQYAGPAFVPTPDQITTYTTTIDGTVRTFDVYVPPGYPNNGPYPVVFMLHGTGQTATRIRQTTQWHRHSRNGGNFIVVYPQAEAYDIVTSGGSIQNQTKWVTSNVLTLMVDSTQAQDDTEFFRTMLNGIVARLDVDCRKIYACGFSNGGAFVKTELRYHFGDKLAATVSTGGVGLPIRYYPTQGHDTPHLETCGTRDDKKLTAFGYPAGSLLPLDPIEILNSPMKPSLDNFARDCGFTWPLASPIKSLSRARPTIIGPIPLGVRVSYSSQTDPNGDPYWTEIEYHDTQTRYRFRMVDDLRHSVPTPVATPAYNREDYIPIYWDFMNSYSLN